MKIVFDIESDGLMENVTKIHCLCYYNITENVSGSLTSYEEIIKFLMQEDLTLIGHNVICYDIPVLNKILGIKIKAELIDTLPLSWVLYPQYKKHGLEAWGEIFGIPKPEISEWKEPEEIELQAEFKAKMVHRCSEDVKINTKLWNRENYILNLLYNKDSFAINRYIQYLSFKMDCVREQEEVGIRIDVNHCEATLALLIEEKKSKVDQLALIMPKNPIKHKKTYEDALMDESGNVFQKGDLFFGLIDTQAKISNIEREKIIRWEAPNPNSPQQIKDWLYGLGWIPETFKHVKNKETNEIKKIPQIASKDGQGELCESIKKLFTKESGLKVLDSLGVISHRISIFKGFLKDRIGDRLYPSSSGLTNTLRLQHKVVVNLPGVDKKYGQEVRASLIADEGRYLCGCDLANIEDRTKRHYIYTYDPEYVEEMNSPSYDSHLDIAKLAGFITEEDAVFYKEIDEKKTKELPITKEEAFRFSSLKKLRAKAKTCNFAATYKVGAETLSRNSGMSIKESKKLLSIYWTRNNAILKVEKSLKVKDCYGQKWLLNPVSGFWHTLRAEKDRFSTLNQGTAVYVFDTWVKYLRAEGIKISLQIHDEWLGNIESKGVTTDRVNKAIESVNKELKLNVQVGCSISFGEAYSECH